MAYAPTIWEYRTVDALDPRLDLDALGRLEWELVGCGPGGIATTLYFKRPGPSFRERVTLDQKRRVYADAGLPTPDEAAGAARP